MFMDIFIALIALEIMSYFYYGFRAVMIAGLCVTASFGCEYFSTILMGKKFTADNLSCVNDGLIIALMKQPTVDWKIPFFAGIFASVAGKNIFFKPRVMTCVPIGITSVEKRAVMEATTQGGASKTYLIEEPLAAALGAGIDITVPRGNMIVDIGGGTTDIAVISLGGIVVCSSIRVGGDHFDEAIMNHVRKEHNVMIGERTAEEIKWQVASVSPNGRKESIEVRGRDLLTGLPRTFSVTSDDCRIALKDSVDAILARIHSVLEECPPELASDIVDNGIYITGGGALLDGFAEVLQKETGITTYVADNPLQCVALGTGKALENLDRLHPGMIYNSSNLI